MAQLPDVYCRIKLIDQPSGKVIPDGQVIQTSPTGSITFRIYCLNFNVLSTAIPPTLNPHAL